MKISLILDEYLHIDSDEQDELDDLKELLKDSNDPLSRKTLPGHITVSAFIINEANKQVLLLEHKSLSRLLQPGGHIENIDKSLMEAVYREIEEETGLKQIDLQLKPLVATKPEVPIDIDTHVIPENPKKQEPKHYHHDFRYLFTTTNSNVVFDPSESSNYKWVDWQQFAQTENFVHVAETIESIFAPNSQDYFKFLTNNKAANISVVAVSHIIPSSEDFILSMQHNFNLVGIIPKPKSINQSSLKRIKRAGVKVLDGITRESIENHPDEFIEILSGSKKICLVDIGGYFAPIEKILISNLKSNFIGIIEDTENGYQKYVKNDSQNRRVLSVARSPLKNYEDQLVGHGIAHAAETLLRQINVILTYKKCGIIGYGKIGRGIGEYLQQRNVKPTVADTNSLRTVQALCDGAYVADVDSIIKECDIIFCATGSQALGLVKFRQLKKGAYLASATSSDDEFDLTHIKDEYSFEKIDSHTTKFFKKGHNFHLFNEGNAINFLFSAAVDKYINLVQGEIVFSLCRLSEYDQTNSVLSNNEDDQRIIADAWLNFVGRNENI